MATIVSLIPELESVLQHGSLAKRSETLTRITDLFLRDSPRYSPDHVDLFDEVLGRLIIEIETRALAELARRIAPVENAPGGVLRTLAGNDDITVAGPVLANARRLADADLVVIARSKSQAHLLAISGRERISEAITDIIVHRGDDKVVRTVADNRGARFSDAGFAALVKRSVQDGVLAEKVGQRPDIPPHMFRRLLIQATDVVQRRLLAAARPETQAEIKRILAKVSEQIGTTAAPKHDFTAAQRTVLAMHKVGKLGEADLANFASAGQYELTVAGLSALCGVSIEVVDRLMSGERPDPALILCKAAGFAWPTVASIIQVAPGAKHMSSNLLDGAMANFERLSLSTAQRVLRFWQARKDGWDADI